MLLHLSEPIDSATYSFENLERNQKLLRALRNQLNGSKQYRVFNLVLLADPSWKEEKVEGSSTMICLCRLDSPALNLIKSGGGSISLTVMHDIQSLIEKVRPKLQKYSDFVENDSLKIELL